MINRKSNKDIWGGASYSSVYNIKKILKRKMGYDSKFAQYSPDSSMALSVSGDGKMKTWGMENHICVHTFSGPKADAIKQRTFNPSGEYIFSFDKNNHITLWSVKGKKYLFSMVLLGIDDYLVVNPGNYYASSKKATKYINWKYDMKLYDYKKFEPKYKRPDFILKVLPNGNTGFTEKNREKD